MHMWDVISDALFWDGILASLFLATVIAVAQYTLHHLYRSRHRATRVSSDLQDVDIQRLLKRVLQKNWRRIKAARVQLKEEYDEQLHVTTPEEAIADYCWNMDTGSEIRAACPIKICAYAHLDPKSAEVRHWIENAANVIVEQYWDDYGDPDDGYDELRRQEMKLVTAFQPIVDAWVAEAPRYACYEVGWREYSYEEVKEILGDEDIDWEA